MLHLKEISVIANYSKWSYHENERCLIENTIPCYQQAIVVHRVSSTGNFVSFCNCCKLLVASWSVKSTSVDKLQKTVEDGWLDTVDRNFIYLIRSGENSCQSRASSGNNCFGPVGLRIVSRRMYFPNNKNLLLLLPESTILDEKPQVWPIWMTQCRLELSCQQPITKTKLVSINNICKVDGVSERWNWLSSNFDTSTEHLHSIFFGWTWVILFKLFPMVSKVRDSHINDFNSNCLRIDNPKIEHYFLYVVFVAHLLQAKTNSFLEAKHNTRGQEKPIIWRFTF